MAGETRRAGAARRMHSPRDMGKRIAERAAGACDLGDSLTTTGVFCLCSRSNDAHFAGHSILAVTAQRGEQPELDSKQCFSYTTDDTRV